MCVGGMGVAETIGSYIRADEKLLWRGRPQQGLRLGGQEFVLAPISLLWGAIVLWMLLSGGFSTARGLPFVLFPLMFALAALYVTLGRFVHDAWLRSRIEYALTDRRVIVLRRGLGDEVTALDLGKLDQVRFRPRGQRGDIFFGPSPRGLNVFGTQGFRSGLALWVPSLSETPQLMGVENARRLYDQIEGLRAAAR